MAGLLRYPGLVCRFLAGVGLRRKRPSELTRRTLPARTELGLGHKPVAALLEFPEDFPQAATGLAAVAAAVMHEHRLSGIYSADHPLVNSVATRPSPVGRVNVPQCGPQSFLSGDPTDGPV